MIKINLLKDSGGTSAGSTQATGIMSFGSGGGGSQLDTKDLIIKFLLILAPIASVYVFGEFTVSQKKDELKAVQTQSKKVEDELKKLDVQVKEVEKFLDEKRKLDGQLDTIKKLSKERLRNVKSLDAIQTFIPQKAWLLSLKMKDTNVEIEGQAIDDIVISDFMREMEDSVFFMNVTLASSEESRLADGTVKKFLIKCNLENM